MTDTVRTNQARLLTAASCGAAAGLALIGLGVFVMHAYGFFLFIATPVVMGLVAGFVSRRQGVSVPRAMVAAVASLFLAALVMWGTGREGAVCLLMSLPLSIPLAMVGVIFAMKLLPDADDVHSAGMKPMLICMASLPIAFVVEPSLLRDPSPVTAEAAIVIDAPANVVWRHMLAFDDMPRSSALMFRAGIAAPINARLTGRGVGATRTCEFTTGTFVEKIDAWDENRRLRFSFVSTPPPLQEWSPFADVHPPHLRGYFVPQWSEFRVVPMSDRRTRLEGTGVYVNRMRPALYWNAWTQTLIHQVHLTVFEHVKRLSEADARATASARIDRPDM
jgi:hypothetical protein